MAKIPRWTNVLHVRVRTAESLEIEKRRKLIVKARQKRAIKKLCEEFEIEPVSLKGIKDDIAFKRERYYASNAGRVEGRAYELGIFK